MATSVVLCAWCSPQVTILGSFESADGSPSHGICETHEAVLMAELEDLKLQASANREIGHQNP